MLRPIAACLFCLFSVIAYASPLPSVPHIYIEGSATVRVEPDEMTFLIMIAHTAPSLNEAKQSVDQRSLELITLSKEIGISAEDIVSTPLRIAPSFTVEDGRLVSGGTNVSLEIDIRLRNLAHYSSVIEAFVKADISQTISTNLVVSDESRYTDLALVKALEDAHQRASILAKSQGKKLGEAYSISEFMGRGVERQALHVSRDIIGLPYKEVQTDNYMPRPIIIGDPFEPGVMAAKASVYVVYLLE